MIYLLFVLLSIIVFVRLSDTDSSVSKLRREVESLKNQINTSDVSEDLSLSSRTDNVSNKDLHHSISHTTQKEGNYTVSENVIRKESAEDAIIAWFKDNWLLKIGVLMILVGFGWFVSYAFIHDWIDPAARIAIGLVVGSLITLFGTARLQKNQVQGNTFTILGSALIIVSVLSGQYFYQFFPPMLSLGIVFLVSVYVSGIAVFYSFEKLATYGFVIALLAPFFSHVLDISNCITLYSYFTIISAAMIWVSIVRGWRSINIIGILAIFLYSLPVISSGYYFFGNDDYSKYFVLISSYIISLLYLCVSAWSLISNKNPKENGATPIDVFLTIITTLMILGFTLGLAPVAHQSFILVVWMFVYLISGLIVFQRTKNEKLFYIHSLVAVLFLGLATSIEWSGKTLIFAFIIEAVVISISSFVVTNKISTAKNFGLLMAIPMFMSIPSIFSSNWNYGSGASMINPDFAILFVIGLALAGLGFFYGTNDEDKDKNVFKIQNLAFVISTIYLYILIWLSSHMSMVNQDSAVFISLFIYTIVGLSAYFMGLFGSSPILKRYGSVLLILVVLRLILVDVWNMELVRRVITFIVLGIMFISTAFISKKQKVDESN